MLMKIAHHNGGKEKWESHTCYLFNDSDAYHEFDITNIRGYGETKEEAVQNLKKELEYYFNELRALGKRKTKFKKFVVSILKSMMICLRKDLLRIEVGLFSKVLSCN